MKRPAKRRLRCPRGRPLAIGLIVVQASRLLVTWLMSKCRHRRERMLNRLIAQFPDIFEGGIGVDLRVVDKAGYFPASQPHGVHPTTRPTPQKNRLHAAYVPQTVYVPQIAYVPQTAYG